jgi:hypothetical protein
MPTNALWTHIKFRKLCKWLEIPEPWGAGHLDALVYYVSQHRHDGNLSGLSDEDIEIAAMWTDRSGAAGAFADALRRVGFIDGDEGKSRMHDWEQWCPRYVRVHLERDKVKQGRDSTPETAVDRPCAPVSARERTKALPPGKEKRREEATRTFRGGKSTSIPLSVQSREAVS